MAKVISAYTERRSFAANDLAGIDGVLGRGFQSLSLRQKAPPCGFPSNTHRSQTLIVPERSLAKRMWLPSGAPQPSG